MKYWLNWEILLDPAEDEFWWGEVFNENGDPVKEEYEDSLNMNFIT